MNSFHYKINFSPSFHINLFRTVVSLLHLLIAPQFFISLVLLNFLFALVTFSLGYHRNFIQVRMLFSYLTTKYFFSRYTVGKITLVPLREVRSNDFGPHG
jgi:hypothetical protein